jgi:hypothetical protein
MMDRTAFRSFDSFEEADQADRLERWRMTPDERMQLLEKLRSYQYPDGKTAPGLQRLLETAEFPRR